MSQQEAVEEVQVLEQDLATVRIALRLPRGVHEQLIARAEEAGIPLNKYMVFALINHLHPGTLVLRPREVVEAEAEHFRQKLAEYKDNAATDEEVERWRRGEIQLTDA
jgi:hypothetical protein